MGVSQAEALRISMADLSPPQDSLYAAGGHELRCRGTFECNLTLGTVTATVTVSVVEGLNCALLSWFDNIALGILSPEFPAQLQRVERTGHAVAFPAPGTPSEEASGTQTDPRTPPPPSTLRPEQTTGDVTGNERGLTGPSRLPHTDVTADERGPPGAPPPPRLDDVTTVRRASSTPSAHVQTSQESQDTGPLPSWDPTLGEPSEQQRQAHLASLKEAFPRVFNTAPPLREMAGGPARITLTDDARPSAATAARPIPYSWQEDIKRQLDELLEQGVIAPVDYPTEWCHQIVAVPKRTDPNAATEGSSVRLTVDLTRLNKYVRRGAHPVCTPQDAVSSIGTGARYFTKLDARSGYFQVPLDRRDQDLTCFITPWGRFRMLRLPQGLSASGDEYNRRGDQALSGIPRTCKIVDDVLAYDSDYAEHLQHVAHILRRCDAAGITLNPSKLAFAEPSVSYCGYDVTSTGYTADQRKFKAIAEFPTPTNITDLRSFLGLGDPAR